jgi:heat shock protein HtpX
VESATAVVNGFTLVLALVGGWLCVAGWPNLFALFGGFLCVLIVWFLRPRFPSLRGKVVSRNEFPTLYKVSGDIARLLGTSNVQGIVVDENFNAALGQVGWRRDKILYLGLPLFSIC